MVLQVADPLREIWGWPLGLQRGITLGLGLGLLPAFVVSWFHGEKGRQDICLTEVLLVGGLTLASAVFILRVCG
jgi:hypothetical protein